MCLIAPLPNIDKHRADNFEFHTRQPRTMYEYFKSVTTYCYIRRRNDVCIAIALLLLFDLLGPYDTLTCCRYGGVFNSRAYDITKL